MDIKRKESVRGKRVLLATMVALGSIASGAQAAGNNTIDLHAILQIGAPVNCGVDVTPPSGESMTARWDKGTPGKLTVTSKIPPSVVVTSTGGASCTLNNLTLTTYANGNNLATDNSFALLRAFNSAGGTQSFWRFIPYLAQAKFYTSVTQDTGAAPFSEISFNSPGSAPSELTEITFQESAKHLAGEPIDAFPDGRTYQFLTDEYAESGGAVLVYGTDNTGHFVSSNPSAAYQSAVLSFGALLATDPDDADGNADPEQAPQEGTPLDISWTVTVSAA